MVLAAWRLIGRQAWRSRPRSSAARSPGVLIQRRFLGLVLFDWDGDRAWRLTKTKSRFPLRGNLLYAGGLIGWPIMVK